MNSMSNMINRITRPFGFMVQRTDTKSLYEHTMDSALQRCRELHKIIPATIIDVGAAEGKWTLLALNEWAKSNYVLFEPLLEREGDLTELKKKYNNIFIINKGAGSEKKEIEFFVTNDLDGSGMADNGTNANKRKIDLTTIDYEISNLKLKGPYLIKLDTHGFEVPILEGAKETLRETQLLIIECYGFKLGPNTLLFWEMCNHLKDMGFRLIDLVDIYLRKKDGAFWQCDAFFIPDNSTCFTSNTYI